MTDDSIDDYNTPPATGIRIDYAASPKLTLTYDNFFGNAAPDTARVKLRFFNEVIAQLKPNASWLSRRRSMLGLDVAFTPKVVWRTEARGFSSSDQVWPTHRAGKYVNNDGFLVTSMALTF